MRAWAAAAAATALFAPAVHHDAAGSGLASRASHCAKMTQHGSTRRLCIGASGRLVGAPRCFGAASLGCDNPALRRLVVPRPSVAELMPDGRCRPTREAVACLFGSLHATGPPRLALLGDSHATSLRATAEVAAQALGLKAVSLTKSGCAFITEHCRRHSAKVLRWLRAHPAVHTALTTATTTAGRDYTADGFREMWSRLPGSVRRVYVFRDNPRITLASAECVRAVSRSHAVSEGACAVPREDALAPDPAVDAAANSAPRFHLIDLTDRFCTATECFPVIGGAYVYRDLTHMNAVFAATLGPYLLAAMRP